jgi:hypothetical protein
MERNTVLSVSPSKEKLIVRHTTLRDAGMKVTSVLSPTEARFEIQMGRCGSLVLEWDHHCPGSPSCHLATVPEAYSITG